MGPSFAAQKAKDLTSPDAFINTDRISLAELQGKKVVLLDFWTYSCINCQRTIPYLNAWYEKYKDYGFTIIGVHTPEFDFEKKYDNVLAAVKKFDIRYPVVLDNDHSTWNAYGNQYWPRKALVNIDGEMVYRHIGEGAYEETEKKIQEALEERSKRLGLKAVIPGGIAKPKLSDTVDFSKMQSPEIYFGSLRNERLENGRAGQKGDQELTAPKKVESNKLYLVGKWDFQNEFAENKSASRIIFKYYAKNVYLVASAEKKQAVKLLLDGKLPMKQAGDDVSGGSVVIKEERLYKLIKDPAGYGEHTLEIIIDRPGLKAFTFTFG